MTRRMTVAGIAVALATAAGCGDTADLSGPRPDPPAGAPVSAAGSAGAASPRTVLRVVRSRYGRVIADGRGEALYLFTRDGRGASKCYGDCAKAWPPLITRRTPTVGSGLQPSGVGTRKRSDGSLQVTYEGRPLYYYVHDKPGVILCQAVTEFGGDWLVVGPSGRPVR